MLARGNYSNSPSVFLKKRKPQREVYAFAVKSSKENTEN